MSTNAMASTCFGNLLVAFVTWGGKVDVQIAKQDR
jgi:hypothetical protein